MTKQHFQHAADIVRAILEGKWTHELPYTHGFDPTPLEIDSSIGNLSIHRVRAEWTAEAFVKLFAEWNPRFDQTRFLVACGLVEPTPKHTR